jgi:tRNA(fMet)-specific endonuclease VapC
LRFGVENSNRVDDNMERLERFLLPLEIVPFDAKANRHYGRVRTDLKRAGCPIGSNDLLIAAHALSLDAPLVTNNIREFARVVGLRVEQWN